MTRRAVLVQALLLWAIALAFRLPDLDAFLNIDAGAVWFGRIRFFWDALGTGAWEKTFQVHPGVTLMWLSGLSLKAGPGLGATITPAMVAAGALPVALVTSLIAPGTFLLWRRWTGAAFPALLAGLLLATEPFLVGHSRTMHLDALLTTFAWLGVLSAGIAFEIKGFRYAGVAGALLAMAVLTKVAGGAVALGVGWVGLVGLIRGPNRKRHLLVLTTVTAVALAVTFAAWPALWVEPVETVRRLLEEVTGQVDRGHRVLSDGVYYAEDPGAGYYLAVLLARLSPEVLLLALVGLAWLLRRSRERHAILLILLAFSVLLFAQLTAAKKIDRYVLPFFPLFALLAAHGVTALAAPLTRRPLLAFVLPVVLLGMPRLARLIAVHPHPIAWSQDWPGRPAGWAITLGFGEGLREAAEWIAHDSAGHRPAVFSGMYRPCMDPWLKYRSTRDLTDPEYILRYISVIQRGFRAREYRRHLKGLLHEVVIDGRVFAEIHAGPNYRGPTKPGFSVPWPKPPDG